MSEPVVSQGEPTPADFHESFDARVWAAEFRRVALTLGYSDMDEGWLISWFANSLMRGYDEHARKVESGVHHERERDTERLAAIVDAGNALAQFCDRWSSPVPPSGDPTDG